MFPPFSQSPAYEECLLLAKDIESSRVRLACSARVSSQRVNSGVMLGVLVCSDSLGKRRVLKCASGNARVLECDSPLENEIFVPSVVSQSLIDRALEKNDREIHELTYRINDLKKEGTETALCEASSLEKKRKSLTDESYDSYLNLFSFMCADRKMRSLKEICSAGKKPVPPSGTGECCAPKLLHYAFSHDLTPLSMCEIFYGASDSRRHLQSYPPCDERCGLILPDMLGLEILYRDEHICVVNKQSGLLSVPGRGEDKQDCLTSRLRRLFPSCIPQPAVHRLDMETSGLVVMAFTKEAHRNLSRQFEEGRVSKEYEALLDGVLRQKGIPDEGQMELYFRLDVDNRPHQIWDDVYGKKAVTQWKVLGIEGYVSPEGKRRNVTRVLFIPHTGRTHQLRLASSDSHGFGVPIIGDTLYGHWEEGERLCLHARYLSFEHPETKQKMEFFNECPF